MTVNATGRVVIRPASECRPGREAALSGLRVVEAAAARIGRIVPNPSRADAPRDSTIEETSSPDA